MNVSIGERWERFVTGIVADGRYGSASEVVREGLRLVEEREAKIKALQNTLNASIAEGGEHDDDSIDAALNAKADELAKAGLSMQEITDLKADIDKGMTDAAAGRVKDFDAARIIERGRKNLAKTKNMDATGRKKL